MANNILPFKSMDKYYVTNTFEYNKFLQKGKLITDPNLIILLNPANKFDYMLTNEDLVEQNLTPLSIILYSVRFDCFKGFVKLKNPNIYDKLMNIKSLNNKYYIEFMYLGDINNYNKPTNNYGLNMQWTLFPNIVFGFNKKDNKSNSPFLPIPTNYFYDILEYKKPLYYILFNDGSIYYFDGLKITRTR